jgi:hypothetical protein
MATAQIIHTDKYGDLRVVQAYHEGPRVILLLENGSYVYDSGLPVQDKAELRKAIPANLLQAALDRFDKHLEREEHPTRAIKIMPNNAVVFEDDGSPVQNIQDIVAYFDAGPFREAAMIAFADKLKADKEAKGPMVMQPKKPVAKKKAPPAAGKSRAKLASPAEHPQAAV